MTIDIAITGRLMMIGNEIMAAIESIVMKITIYFRLMTKTLIAMLGVVAQRQCVVTQHECVVTQCQCVITQWQCIVTQRQCVVTQRNCVVTQSQCVVTHWDLVKCFINFNYQMNIFEKCIFANSFKDKI